MSVRLLLPMAAIVTLLLAGCWSSQEQQLRTFPHTYIAVEDAGYDLDRILVRPGTVHAETELVIDGISYYRVYTHPDPAVVPQRDGQRYLIPLIPVPPADDDPYAEPVWRTPPLPPHDRPLSREEIARLERWFTPEGAEQIRHMQAERGMGSSP